MSSDHGSTMQLHSYAVNPSEHVFQPSVTSALFPHLPQQRSAPYRLALLAVAVSLVLFGYLRLTGPFVALTSVAIPGVYGVYLYEIDIYEGEPIYAVGMTAGTGILLGAIFALLTGHFVTLTFILAALPHGAPVGRVLLVAVGLPLVAQALMLVGPFILRFTRSYSRVLDGFAFGAASALGFVLASNLVYLVPELRSGPIAVTSGTLFALRAVLHGLMVPLIDAGTTGVIAAAVWLHGRNNPQPGRYSWITSVWTSLAVAAAVQVGLGLADVLVVNSTTAILIYLGVSIALLFWVRAALHAMVLVQAGDNQSGSETT